MNDATRAKARRIAELIHSARAKRGPFSIYSRIKEAHIAGYAEHLATVYPNNLPTGDELTRSLNLHAGTQPQCFNTPDDITKANRQRMSIEHGRRRVIRDVDRKVIESLTPEEKLSLANGSGLPRRFVLKIYEGEDE